MFKSYEVGNICDEDTRKTGASVLIFSLQQVEHSASAWKGLVGRWGGRRGKWAAAHSSSGSDQPPLLLLWKPQLDLHRATLACSVQQE